MSRNALGGGRSGKGKAYYLMINQTHGTRETSKADLMLDFSSLKKNILKNKYCYFSQPESPRGLFICLSINTSVRILLLGLFHFCTFFRFSEPRI